MPADVIKEAVIKLGIQQANVTLQAPDLSPILDSTRVASEQIEALTKNTALANAANIELTESIRTLTEAIDRESAANKRNAADRKASTDDWLKSTDAKMDHLEELLDAIDEEINAEKRRAQASIDANIKVMEGMKQAGEGVFTLTRGITLLGFSGSENLDKVVKAVATVQAGFDLFKGATDTIKGVTEAQRALATVSAAAGVANEVNAGSIALTGTAAAAATPPTAAFAVAVNAALLPLTALIAVGAVAIGFIKQYADALGEAEKAEHDLRVKRAETTAEYLKQTEGRIAAANKEAESIKGLLSDQTLLERAGIAANRRDNYAILALRDNQPAGWATDRAAISLAAGSDAVKLQDQLVQRAEQRLSLAKETNHEALQEVRLADEKVQRAKQLVDAEDSRVRAMQAQIGALDANERRELERLAKKVEGGDDLSREELMRLGQLGGGRTQGFVQEQFAQQGQGLDRLLENIFGGDRQEELQSELARLTEALKEFIGDRSASATIAQLEQERNEAVAQAQATVDTMKGIMVTAVEELRRVHRELEEIGNAAR